MSIVIDGTGTISGVSATGISTAQTVTSVTSSALPAGTVLQVVQATTTTAYTTSSTSMVSTGFSASITPKFATSKILVNVTGGFDTQTGGRQICLNVYRGATPLAGNGFILGFADNARLQTSSSLNYLDSPATTSSTTYTLYYAVTYGGGSVIYNIGGTTGETATFTLTEIAA